MTDPVQLSSRAVDRPSTSLTRTKQVAERLEASFLAEMLKFGGLDPKSDSFVASTGESQFASFHREALAQEMVKAGGIGLADVFYRSMMERAHDA
ncbi:flagellar rod assembly protein/muramidase FlgJ [Roseovarius mucosus]|uniref:Flagellar rod assembly protein/muramidase FlgJ n=1 Tax=Roseovarius mucosus TaxID=215743 RepID=A0A1V0RNI5_9RHOB|nr:rod-binding protein [Roseovarius mucosus]ARE83152.1 flagellar rod assembly protein/muramidase FlgJ [Roseovarius mucosus]